MTLTTTPTYSLNFDASQVLFQDISKAQATIARMTKRTKAKVKTPKRRAKPVAKAKKTTPADPAAGTLTTCLLGSILLDTLFGLPLFSGLSEATQGLAHVGLLGAQESYKEAYQEPAAKKAPKSRAAPVASTFRDMTLAAKQEELLEMLLAQMGQAEQLALLKQMTKTLMAHIAMQRRSAPGLTPVQELVPDAYREPKMGQFKQNLHSVSCIRTLFARESRITAPKYRLAA